MLGYFHLFLSHLDCLFLIIHVHVTFKGYHQSVKSLDPDQARHFVRPDLSPSCLQGLSAKYTTIRQRVKELFHEQRLQEIERRPLTRSFGTVN